MDGISDLAATLAPERSSFDAPVEALPAHAPPFVLVEPIGRRAPLVLASPHSGRRYPAELLDSSRLDPLTLRKSEDVLVDELFSAGPSHGAALIAATYARAWCDLNRDPREIDTTMFLDPPPGHAVNRSARVQAGLGAIARIVGDGLEIYARKLKYADAERRIEQVWSPYHTALARLVSDTRQLHGGVVLVDCHSMPSAAKGTDGADIILGDRFGQSAPSAIAGFTQTALERMGYRVARNTPYAGGYVTQTYGRPGQRQFALQIEISRGIYLDEKTLEPNAHFAKVRRDMGNLIALLSEAVEARRFF
jgi:N-formylglutamate amidohydrolase